jgi:hypothetical protein
MTETDHFGQVVRFGYTSAAGQDVLAYVEDPSGQHINVSLDGTPRLIELDDPASRHYLVGYSGHRLTSVTRDGSTQFTVTYQPDGRLASLTRQVGSLASVTYDSSGRVWTTTVQLPGSEASTVSYRYPTASGDCQAAGGVGMTEVEYAPGSVTTYCYSASGAVVSQSGFATDGELGAIEDRLTAQAQEPGSGINEVGVEDGATAVDVGVNDVGSPESVAIKRRYGEAVHIYQAGELDSLVDSAPGADELKNPMVAGVRISSPEHSCTAGFTYRGSLNAGEPDIEDGVITAGHCVFDNPVTTIWFQGGKRLGTYSRHRLVNNSVADAGTITTKSGDFVQRPISNELFRGPGRDNYHVTDRKPAGIGRRGATVCLAGATSGYHCGNIVRVGPRSGSFRRGVTRRVMGKVILNLYAYDPPPDHPCSLGDSGGAVIDVGDTSNLKVAAVGILSGRGQDGYCYYSQAVNAEYELRVPIYLGG